MQGNIFKQKNVLECTIDSNQRENQKTSQAYKIHLSNISFHFLPNNPPYIISFPSTITFITLRQSIFPSLPLSQTQLYMHNFPSWNFSSLSGWLENCPINHAWDVRTYRSLSSTMNKDPIINHRQLSITVGFHTRGEGKITQSAMLIRHWKIARILISFSSVNAKFMLIENRLLFKARRVAQWGTSRNS